MSQKNQSSPTGSKMILLLSCSPRDGCHTFELLKSAEDQLGNYPCLTLQMDTLAEKQIYSCQNCSDRCSKEGHCWLEDDFDDLARNWLKADGIVIGSPVYTFGPPAPVYAFFERLQALQRANPSAFTSACWPQPVGIVAQGGSEYGGAEVCAQTLLSLCISVGCTPVSGDMPGFSQGVIGQIGDGGEIPVRLKEGVRRLAARVVEASQILYAGKKADSTVLRFLIARCCDEGVADPLHQVLASNTAKIQELNVSLEWRQFDFNASRIAPCLGCSQYCSQDLECRFQDDMQAFRSEWLAADAIFWLVGQRYGRSLFPIRAAVDRMNQVRFETYFASGYRHMPRYLKVAVPLVVTEDREKQDSALRYLRHISLLYQNILLPAWGQNSYEPGNYLNALGCMAEAEFPSGMLETMIQKAVVLALVLRSGISQLQDDLPEEYFPSQTSFAKIGLDAGV